MHNILTISHDDARPRFAIRLGITGHRTFDAKQTADLEAAVRRIFADLKTQMAAVLAQEGAARTYRPEPLIHLTSPLAEGADRIAARAAIAEGAILSAALPMPATEYKRDFAPGDTEFERLRSVAAENGAVTELYLAAIHTKEERDASYAHVGSYIRRHSDILIAIWDGQPARGTGGTANVIVEAIEMGLPVIHIQSDRPETVTILKGESKSQYAPDLLASFVTAFAFPRGAATERVENKGHNELDQIAAADAYYRDTVAAPSGEPDSFLYQGPFKAAPNWFGSTAAGIYPLWISLFKKPTDTKDKPPFTFVSPQTTYLFRHFQRADVLATYYSDLHRSVFFLAYLLAGVALFGAFASLGVKAYGHAMEIEHSAAVFVGLELALLFAILIIVGLEQWFGWRDKWLNYRWLAELLRQTDILAVAGRPMPFRILHELGADLPGRRWVPHVYCAIVRSAGIAPSTVTPAHLQALSAYVSHTRLQDQIEYHSKTEAKNDAAGRFMKTASLWFFGLTIAAVAAKTAVMHWDKSAYDWLLVLSIAASVFPAAAYIFFAIRSQAEFEMVGRRSARMLRRLKAVKAEIDGARANNLTLDDLGEDILKSAAIMRHDAADWASIFEVKETERG